MYPLYPNKTSVIFVNIGSDNDATEPFYKLILTHNWQDYNGRSSVKFQILLLFENDVLKWKSLFSGTN